MKRLYDRTKIDKANLLYTDKAIWLLALPIIFEQFLNSLMGMADTMMVSKVAEIGEIAVSAVSLVDSVNNLVVQVFSALTAGAAIVCSQYIGKKDVPGANHAARQVFLSVVVISTGLAMICIALREPLLRLIFGQVDEAVMEKAVRYFLITAASYPFLATANVGGSIFRAQGNSRFPMIVSVCCNILNVLGNALAIFVLKWGVEGAALSTLISRIANSTVLMACLRRKKNVIRVDNYFSIRPDFKVIRVILAIGIPSGIENGMFQFGKLAVQSTVSTLGTAAISAQAIAIVVELFTAYGGIGVGLAMMTIVGQSIGAGRYEEAKYYTFRGLVFGEIVVAIACVIGILLSKQFIGFSGLGEESARICWEVSTFANAMKIFFWAPSFMLGYGMRAAGDVRFSMVVSCTTMWALRVTLSVVLVRYFHMGLISVWIGMVSDWIARGIIFFIRFRSGKWLKKAVV